MDNRITKTRLGNLLSYDWLKIIAIIIAIAAGKCTGTLLFYFLGWQ